MILAKARIICCIAPSTSDPGELVGLGSGPGPATRRVTARRRALCGRRDVKFQGSSAARSPVPVVLRQQLVKALPWPLGANPSSCPTRLMCLTPPRVELVFVLFYPLLNISYGSSAAGS